MFILANQRSPSIASSQWERFNLANQVVRLKLDFQFA
jgi:hypothetical protein